MKKIFYTFLTSGVLATPLFANDLKNGEGNNLAIIIALVALVVTLFNILWMLRFRKIYRVDMINQKEDLNLTMEGIKTELTRDIRSNRKEVQRLQSLNRNDKNPQLVKKEPLSNETKENSFQKGTNTERTDDDLTPQKPKKKYYHRYKRPNEGQKGSSKE